MIPPLNGGACSTHWLALPGPRRAFGREGRKGSTTLDCAGSGEECGAWTGRFMMSSYICPKVGERRSHIYAATPGTYSFTPDSYHRVFTGPERPYWANSLSFVHFIRIWPYRGTQIIIYLLILYVSCNTALGRVQIEQQPRVEFNTLLRPIVCQKFLLVLEPCVPNHSLSTPDERRARPYLCTYLQVSGWEDKVLIMALSGRLIQVACKVCCCFRWRLLHYIESCRCRSYGLSDGMSSWEVYCRYV